MTPDEIKAQQAKVKAQQEELQRRGLYRGKIDGVMGDSTADAQKEADRLDAAAAAQKESSAKGERDAELERGRQSIELLKAQGQKGATDASTAELLAKTKRKEVYDEAANSWPGIVTQTAAGVPSVIAGTASGLGSGKVTNLVMDAAQRSRNETLAKTAADRVAGLTTLQGAREAADLAGAMPSKYSAARVAGRVAPNLVLAAMAAGKGRALLNEEGDDDTFYPKMVNRMGGWGMIGSGAGLAMQGVRYGVSPGVAPDAASIAIINSNQLRRNNTPPEALPGPAPGSRAALVAEAKAAGITKGVAKMNMTTLAAKLVEAKQAAPAALTKLPGVIAAPGIAAALAYGMTPKRAEAADGSPGGANTAEALTNAAGTGAVTAGGGYGASKLAQALAGTRAGQIVLPAARAAGRALGAGLGATAAPQIADAATDFQPGEMDQARNWAARNLPAAATDYMPATRDAREMAQVPEPSPVARPERLQNAAALEIPGNIPPNAARDAEAAAAAPPQANGGMPDMDTQIQILQQHGVDPDLIRAYIAAQQPPAQQAAAAQ